jgi:hypothetical protein
MLSFVMDTMDFPNPCFIITRIVLPRMKNGRGNPLHVPGWPAGDANPGPAIRPRLRRQRPLSLSEVGETAAAALQPRANFFSWRT